MQTSQSSRRKVAASLSGSAGRAASLDFVSLFDDIFGVECFVKDVEGRRLSVSQGIWKRLGFASAREIIGKKDHGGMIHASYCGPIHSKRPGGNLLGMSTGGPVGDLGDEQGVLDWFLVSKYPVFGKDGSVIGIMGTLPFGSERTGRLSRRKVPCLEESWSLCGKHFHRPLSVGELAKVAGLHR
jgi:hypothetical protein